MKKVFVDFDETIFHHHAYLRWVDEFLIKHDVAGGSYESLINDFHTTMGDNMRLYDHIGHIETVVKRSWSFMSGEIEKELKNSKRDFCYDDAHDFFKRIYNNANYDVRILTYGNGEYQRYKIKTCRLLEHIRVPIHVVDEPKGDFLKREFNKVEGVLIDDKHPLHLPSGWKHVWINRSDSMVANRLSSKKVEVVKSLAEINSL